MNLVLSFSILLAVSVKAEVQCGNLNYCQVGFRPYQSQSNNEFLEKRKDAMKLQVLAANKIIGVHNQSELWSLAEKQKELCDDDTIGFILDENVSNYQVACVWTGSSQHGQCQAVPPHYINSSFNYISQDDWFERLKKVRKEMGCYERQHLNSNRNGLVYHFKTELFICNSYCVQGGISYLASIAIITALAISCFKNCLDRQ